MNATMERVAFAGGPLHGQVRLVNLYDFQEEIHCLQPSIPRQSYDSCEPPLLQYLPRCVYRRRRNPDLSWGTVFEYAGTR